MFPFPGIVSDRPANSLEKTCSLEVVAFPLRGPVSTNWGPQKCSGIVILLAGILVSLTLVDRDRDRQDARTAHKTRHKTRQKTLCVLHAV